MTKVAGAAAAAAIRAWRRAASGCSARRVLDQASRNRPRMHARAVFHEPPGRSPQMPPRGRTLGAAADHCCVYPADALLGTHCKVAKTRDRAGDLQIFSLTLSQLSYRGSLSLFDDCITVSYVVEPESPMTKVAGAAAAAAIRAWRRAASGCSARRPQSFTKLVALSGRSPHVPGWGVGGSSPGNHRGILSSALVQFPQCGTLFC